MEAALESLEQRGLLHNPKLKAALLESAKDTLSHIAPPKKDKVDPGKNEG